MIGSLIAVALYAIGAAGQKLALDFALFGEQKDVIWYHYWLVILGWPLFVSLDIIEHFAGPSNDE